MIKGSQYVPREERTCEKCSKPFLVKPSSKAGAKRRFCSKECSFGMQKGRFVADKSPRWIDRVTIRCEVCGTEFQDRPAAHRRTCSRACADKSFERRVTLTCHQCGKPYEKRAKYAKKQKYCSRACRTAAMPTANTSIERKVAELLKDVPGVHAHYPFDSFIVDFAIPDKRLFIECDGSYWHSLPETQRRDLIKDRLATERGWTMLRLGERDINERLDECKARIATALSHG